MNKDTGGLQPGRDPDDIDAPQAALNRMREAAADLNFAVQDVPELGIGSGLSDVELGLRLRYELVREFAPYVGVNWERKLGQTARMTRANGDGASVASFVLGVRFWF